jgi:peptide/nickel transport system substrate-binding protein
MRRFMCLVFFCVLVSGGIWAKPRQEEQGAVKTLRIGTTNQVQTSFPFSDYYLGIFLKLSNLTLMTMNRHGELVGLAADSYVVSEDFKVWTFTMRDDLYWSDGKRMTAKDAAFSLVYTGKNDPNAGWLARTMISAEAPDDRTLVLTFNQPYNNLNLEFTSYNIYPEHVWATVENPMAYGAPEAGIGAGPFVLERVDLDNALVTLVRNQYWRGDRPYFDKLEIHLYKSQDILALAMERGEVDVFYNYAATYPYAYLSRLAGNEHFSFEENLNLGLLFMGFNLREAPMNESGFREALSFGINYEEIARLDAVGYGTVARRGFLPESAGGYIETERLSYDPARANMMLDRLGWTRRDNEDRRVKDGKELRLTLLIRQDYGRVAELIKSYCKDIGIDLTIKTVDMTSWVSEKDAYNYDLTITRTTPWGMLMHANFGTGYFDARRTGQGVLHNLDDKVFLSLCDQLLATVDEGKVRTLGAELQRYYARELPGIALYWSTIVIPHRKDIFGFISSPLFGIYTVESMVNVKKAE